MAVNFLLFVALMLFLHQTTNFSTEDIILYEKKAQWISRGEAGPISDLLIGSSSIKLLNEVTHQTICGPKKGIPSRFNQAQAFVMP